MAPLEAGVLFLRCLSVEERGDMKCAGNLHRVGGGGRHSGGRRQVGIGQGIGGMIV